MATGDGPGLLHRVDRWQRERRWAGFPVAVLRKYADDRASRHAARIAYYGFFSVFPLLLAFVSVVGFVLQGNPELRQDIVDSAFADLPVIGPLVRNDIGSIGGSGLGLVVGVGVALWAGLGVMLALAQALDDVWNVAPVDQLGYVARRLRALAALALVGVALVASAILAGVATGGQLGGTGAAIAAVALSVAVDAAALTAAFRLLPTSPPPVRTLAPGVAVATAGLLGLQALGGWYVSRTIAGASDTYGLFATVIGLLSWLSLAAQLLLIAAEVNAVHALSLWPRSLRGVDTSADARALARYAESARRDAREEVLVRWQGEPPIS